MVPGLLFERQLVEYGWHRLTVYSLSLIKRTRLLPGFFGQMYDYDRPRPEFLED